MTSSRSQSCPPATDAGPAADATSSAAAERDHASFVEQLFDRHRQALMRYVRGLLRHQADAEDVLQETYLRLLKSARLERTAARARAYAFKVATNLAYDRFRRREERSLEEARLDQEPAGVGHEPETIVGLAQALERIESTLLELAPRCRRVFLLRAAEGLGYEDIADALGVSKRTVEREMKRALETMQTRLKGY